MGGPISSRSLPQSLPIPFKKTGKWGVVTGATDGIGRAYANALAKAGTPATSLDTSVEVDFQPGVGITEIRINVTGVVEGLDADGFSAAAHDAKANCPVSKALSAVPIHLQVR